METNRPIDRLLIFLEYKQIKPAAAERLLVLSNGYLKNAVKRDGGIGSDILDRIHKAFMDLNLIWLITGEEDMLKPADNDAGTPSANWSVHEPEERYITTTPITSKEVDTATGSKLVHPAVHPTTILSPQIISVDGSGRENILYVPVKAAAGYLNGYADREFMETLPAFSMPGLDDATYRMFEVDGDSMVPTLIHKQRVIGRWVEKLDYIREDHVHIVVTKNRGVVIKRLLNRIQKYGYIVAKSDALDDRNLYPNIEIYPDEILEIWFGVMHAGFNFKHPTDMYKRVNNIEADLTEVLRILKVKNLLP